MDQDLEAKKAAFIRKKKAEMAAQQAADQAAKAAIIGMDDDIDAGDLSQAAVDALMNAAPAPKQEKNDQDEIDRLMAQLAGGKVNAEPEPEPEEEEAFDQDEIDRLMAEAMGGSIASDDAIDRVEEEESEPLPEDEVPAEPAEALTMEPEEEPEEPAPAPKVVSTPAKDRPVPTSRIVVVTPSEKPKPAAEPEFIVEPEPAAAPKRFVEPAPIAPPPRTEEPVFMKAATDQSIDDIIASLSHGRIYDEAQEQEYIRRRKVSALADKLESVLAHAVAIIPDDAMSAQDKAAAVRQTIGRLCTKYRLFE